MWLTDLVWGFGVVWCGKTVCDTSDGTWCGAVWGDRARRRMVWCSVARCGVQCIEKFQCI